MTGLQTSLSGVTSLPRSLYVAAATAMGVVILALSLTPFAEPFIARLLLFYLGTLGAYALMPFVRRDDIPLVAAWVVLLSELAPCVAGQLISPIKVTADALGVLMAAGPIYVARFRQVRQGDTRPAGRRASDHQEKA
jgi:hypothetical protein